jgi:hypothetical protein
MDEILVCTGFVLVTVGAAYYFILCALKNNRDVANKKLDAIAEMMIALKHR